MNWKYIALGEYPTKNGLCIVARKISKWSGTSIERWSKTRHAFERGWDGIYAWMPCPDVPPLEPPEAKL